MQRPWGKNVPAKRHVWLEQVSKKPGDNIREVHMVMIRTSDDQDDDNNGDQGKGG